MRSGDADAGWRGGAGAGPGRAALWGEFIYGVIIRHTDVGYTVHYRLVEIYGAIYQKMQNFMLNIMV